MDDMRSTHGTAPRHPHGGDGTGGAYTPGSDANPQQGTRPAVPPGEGQISDDEQATHSAGEATTSSSKPTTDGWTSFGSIATTGLSDTPIYKIVVPETAPNFIRGAYLFVQHNDSHFFKLVDGVLSVESAMITLSAKGMRASEIGRPIFQTNDEPLDESQTRTMVIQWSPHLRRPLPDVERAEVQKIAADQVKCRFQAHFNLRKPSLYFDDSLRIQHATFHDNYGLYAKLMYWALVLDYQDVCGQAVSFPPFGSDDTVNWVDLDSDEAASTIITEDGKGSLMLMENSNFAARDLQTILWLAREGSRVRSAPGVRTPDMCYVKWPSINVCLLGRGEAPVWPEAAPLTSSDLHSFASSLASRRGEDADLCRGVYCAMDICGVRYGKSNNVNYPLDTFLSPVPPMPPEPRYDIYLQVFGIKPPEDPARLGEWAAWGMSSKLRKIKMAAFYVACMQSLTTTYLYSLSLSTRDIVKCTSTGVRSTHAFLLIKDLSRGNALYFKVKAAFSHYTGYNVETDLYPYSFSWGQSPHGICCDPDQGTEEHYKALGCIMEMAPRFGSVLAIDNLLMLRPQEWGVLGQETTFDLRETYVQGTPEFTGFYAHRGDRTYATRFSSKSPYLVAPYGVFMLNIVAQYFAIEGVAPYFKPDYCSENGPPINEFHWPNELYEAFSFNKDLHIYEPCSVWTYDMSKSEIRSPVAIPPMLSAMQALHYVGGDNRGRIPLVGFLNPFRFSCGRPPPILDMRPPLGLTTTH